MRTSNLTDREVTGIQTINQGQTQLAQIKKAITQTILAKKREEVRDDLRAAGDRARDRAGGYAEAPNFHLDGDSDDDEDSMSESECSEQWYELDGQEQEALISLRHARKKLQHATKYKKILPKRWWPCKEHRKIHRRVEEGDDVQSMRCHWSLGRRLHAACQKPKEEISLCKGQRNKSSVQEKI